MRAAVLGSATLVAGLLLTSDVKPADACGCLSPPAVTEGQFAVNQQAEQIIFEVEPGWVTAHVLIKYAGDPSQFAWIVPVPEAPESLGISPASAFGLLDQATAPQVSTTLENICPVSEWACAYHNQPSCGFQFESDTAGTGSGGGASLSDAGASGGGMPVDIIDQQVVGDYQTITFRASEAAAATQWLRDNGFIVNQTTSIYMETYVQQNFVFVAAKLVPGAGTKAIKPLKLRYRSAYPMVPLILTAVAAEPHLTVTSFIYGDSIYRALGHPAVTIDATRIAQDSKGRGNYPMVLARTIDEAGGDGFIQEYRGWPTVPNLNQNNNCCLSSYDQCGLAGDGQCQCPLSEVDAVDCQASGSDLLEGVTLLQDLAGKYGALTRITTRVSAEEMTFDPSFEPDFANNYNRTGQLYLTGSQASLAACAGAVIDQEAFIDADAKQSCASTYCGQGGTCVVTNSGPACRCDANFVAQRFTDYDGQPSVTCVPKTPPVDLRANGEQLPDACINISCGAGTCVDRNGVAVCECSAGAAAAIGGTVPRCETIVFDTNTRGGEDYSEPLRDLDVCAPPPPTCYPGGWLHKVASPNPGVKCGGTEPPEELTRKPPAPTCGGLFGGACGCQTQGPPPVSMVVVFGLVGVLVLRRRPRGRGR
jgi:uncharacterized protein (TIGR03382 family)